MTDKVTHYDYYKAIPRTAFNKRVVNKVIEIIGILFQIGFHHFMKNVTKVI